ncbi:NUDIX domain-containing protein [Thermodesulforhabdus norvegica]|uniref:8-oxo-dGTP diphosphatase n=1 Tax=Thermodesulforhabdus norvegica TaxID=39841 RepID=A0A1I4SPN9_9BACT|nr:NUDIX hydrolase [Thermodesulforhabdus norvegica]SFM66263.1 8-oxo-dGTP diphosphatase [Thermodesulforhabdus norvegica]
MKSVRCPNCGFTVHVYRNPFLTVDCIIVNHRNEILLIERKNPPYGWALPGGFVDYGESLEDAVRREIKEETGLELHTLNQFRAYSDPARDPRHHTVTVVFWTEMEADPVAGDDAARCAFFPLDNLPSPIAFDHGKIIEEFRSWKKLS